MMLNEPNADMATQSKKEVTTSSVLTASIKDIENKLRRLSKFSLFKKSEDLMSDAESSTSDEKTWHRDVDDVPHSVKMEKYDSSIYEVIKKEPDSFLEQPTKDSIVCKEKRKEIAIYVENLSSVMNCVEYYLKKDFTIRIFSLTESKDELLRGFSDGFVFNPAKVPCLKSAKGLKQDCEKLGLMMNEEEPDFDGEVYEVETILGHKFQGEEEMYCVKWKGYPYSANTWEPEWNLGDCANILCYYKTMAGAVTLTKNIWHMFLNNVIRHKPHDLLTLRRLFVLFTRKPFKDSEMLDYSELKEVVEVGFKFSNHRIKKLSIDIVELIDFFEQRKETLASVKEWEEEINASFPKWPHVSVENDADLEKPPRDFVFIADYVATFPLPHVPAFGCKCREGDCCTRKSKCCPILCSSLFPYDKRRLLRLDAGHAIYECNDKCHCGSECINRVVQHGPKVRVAIFRTNNGCGWGLKALEPIRKGQFVIEYIGEIITTTEADRRGKANNYFGRSYLFDLDYEEENCKYTIDAFIMGNPSHFINHSCNPNLLVYVVWINNLHTDIPRLAFFATRKIKRGEELTFHYKMISGEGEVGQQILCKCNAPQCQKILC